MTTPRTRPRKTLLVGIFILLLTLGSDALFAADSCSVTGEQKIAIVLVSFPSKPLLSAITADNLQRLYFGPSSSVDSFLRESSYGKTWATGNVVGPVVLDKDYFNQPEAARDAAIRAASSLIDFRNYSRLVMVVPQSSAGLESGGYATIGCTSVPTPQGSITASTTWLGDVSMGSDSEALAAATHEMGHNFGLEHARAADFGTDALGPVGQLPADFDQTRDYGDSFSNMARGQGHWAAPHKSFLGWLSSGTDIGSVEASGTFSIQPYENSTGLRAIRVRRGTGNNAWLWLEYRRPTGYDSRLPSSAFTGAIVHYEDPGWKDTLIHTNLVRFNSDIERDIFFGRAPLAAGATWADPYSNLTIKVTQANSAGMTVEVSYAAPPACPASLNPTSLSFNGSGGTGGIDVVAPAGCSWTATASASWITISSGSSGTGNGRVSFSISANPGTSSRSARITLGSLVTAITQSGIAGSLTLSSTSATFTAAGGAGSVDIITNAPDYVWDFVSNVPWIQSFSVSKSSNVGSATLRFIVAQNTTSSSRTGTIIVSGVTFTVTQAAGAGQISAQFKWQEFTTRDAPISRLCMDMAPFTARGEAVLYGGGSDGTTFTDTWVWNGSSWTQKHPAHNPGPRCSHAMAYDAGRQQVVLFGGWGANSQFSNETWIWDGNDWTQLHPPASPPARSYHAMTYEPSSGKILMFGGTGDIDGGKFNDTWEWNGSTWTQRLVSKAPPARTGHALAYDAVHNEVLLFGGAIDVYSGTTPPTFYSDTWAWDGSQWKQKTPSVSPAGRWGHRMEYDPDLGQIVLVGGAGGKDIKPSPPYTYTFDLREDTWTWDGTNWQQQFPDKSPEFSYSYGMFYDSVHGSFVVHLGDDLHCADRGPKTYSLKVTVPPRTFSVADRGGISLASSGTGSSVSSGYARVQPDGASSVPSGLEIFGYRQNGVLVSEAAVPASGLVQSGRIYVEVSRTVNTGLAISNPGTVATTISTYFTDAKGNNFGGNTFTIPANGKIAAFLTDPPFYGSSSINGTMTFTSTNPVSVVALRGVTNERSEFLITTLPVTDLNTLAATGTVFAPDYADGGGWQTQVVLVNPSDNPLSGSLRFRDASGNPAGATLTYSIAARSSQTIATSGTAASTASGSVSIVPDGNAISPAGLAILTYRRDGKTVAAAGMPFQPSGAAFRVYAEASGALFSSGFIQTGVALMNSSSSSAPVTFELTRLDGTSMGITGTLTIPANGQVSEFLTEIPGFSSLPLPFQGVLRISSSTAISVIGLRARFNERTDFLFSSTPAVIEAAPAVQGPIYFPHIVDSGGYSTQFILFSGRPGQSGSGNIQLFSATGGVLNWTIQ